MVVDSLVNHIFLYHVHCFDKYHYIRCWITLFMGVIFLIWVFWQCEYRMKKLRNEDKSLREIRGKLKAQKHWDKVKSSYSWKGSKLSYLLFSFQICVPYLPVAHVCIHHVPVEKVCHLYMELSKSGRHAWKQQWADRVLHWRDNEAIASNEVLTEAKLSKQKGCK